MDALLKKKMNIVKLVYKGQHFRRTNKGSYGCLVEKKIQWDASDFIWNLQLNRKIRLLNVLRDSQNNELGETDEKTATKKEKH